KGFLPGTYQPTVLRGTGDPVLYLDAPGERGRVSAPRSEQRDVLDMVQFLNREHRAARGEGVDDLASRIASYELAFRMQSAVPEAVDLAREAEITKELYGLNHAISGRLGGNFVVAGRL